MKNLWNRASLKNFFRKGQLPSEVHFGYLIDSTINKLDDGFTKTDTDGLQLSPTGPENNIISIFKDPSEENPSWQISLQNDENGSGLSFGSVEENADGSVIRDSRFFLANNGNIGIGTTSPRTRLELNGSLGVKTRIGALAGQVAGNGQWQDVLQSDTEDMQAYEVVARIDGPEGKGKRAMTHAIALCSFGRSGRIRQTRVYIGWFWNRIEFRWHRDAEKYTLQVRTRTNYGRSGEDDISYKISFHVTQLWDSSVFPKL